MIYTRFIRRDSADVPCFVSLCTLCPPPRQSWTADAAWRLAQAGRATFLTLPWLATYCSASARWPIDLDNFRSSVLQNSTLLEAALNCAQHAGNVEKPHALASAVWPFFGQHSAVSETMRREDGLQRLNMRLCQVSDYAYQRGGSVLVQLRKQILGSQ